MTKLIVMAVLLAASLSFATSPTGRGGGETEKIGEERLVRYIDKDNKIFNSAGNSAAKLGSREASLAHDVNQGLSALRKSLESNVALDPDIKTVLQSMFTKSYTDLAYRYLAETKFEIKETGPCLTLDGEHREAAVKEFKRGAPICLSQELLSNLPYSSMRTELPALIIHELAHQFKFEELRAKKVYLYYKTNLSLGAIHSKARKLIVQTLAQVKSSFESMAYRIENMNYEKGEICIAIGKYDTHVENLMSYLWSAPAGSINSTDLNISYAESIELAELSISLRQNQFEYYGYCLRDFKRDYITELAREGRPIVNAIENGIYEKFNKVSAQEIEND